MALRVCGPVTTDRQGRELIEHGTALFPVACYHDRLSETAVPWHWHDEMEILVVESGRTRVSVNGTDCLVAQGEGFFINAGALHGAWPEGEDVCCVRSIVFHPRLVGGSVDSILWQKYLEPLLYDDGFPFCLLSRSVPWQREALQAAEKAWLSCAAEKPGFEFSVRSSLSELLYLLHANRPRTGQSRPSPKALREQERMKRMLTYIHEHSSLELTVLKIAESALVSESECLRCFKNIIGMAPIRYVKQYRLQKAAELLVNSQEPIAAVAASCGFQEMSYFAKAFREAYAMTPSAWRNVHRRSSSPESPSSSKISR